MRSRALLVAAAALAIVTVAAAPDPRVPARRLGAATVRERDEATAELRALGEAARPALEEAAASPDAEVRLRARDLLRRLGSGGSERSESRYREAVLLLRDARQGGARAGAAGESAPDGAPLPGTSLDDELRRLAPESGSALADLAFATTRRTFVDTPLACALARHATPDTFAALARTWRDERLVPSAALRAAAVIDAAIDAARAGDPERAESLRRAAAGALDVLGDPLLAPEDPRRRAGVALAAAFAGPDAEELLLRAARDYAPGVRCEAARALGRHLASTAAETLRTLAADRNPAVREAALGALLRVPGGPRPEPAVRAAKDDVAAVRRAAATLLAGEATPDEIPLLDQLSRDPSPSVRAAARRSLAVIFPPPEGRRTPAGD